MQCIVRVYLLPLPPLSIGRRYCDAWRHAVCVCVSSGSISVFLCVSLCCSFLFVYMGHVA